MKLSWCIERPDLWSPAAAVDDGRLWALTGEAQAVKGLGAAKGAIDKAAQGLLLQFSLTRDSVKPNEAILVQPTQGNASSPVSSSPVRGNFLRL